jgi:histidinol-phosphate aminotransferase
VAQVFVGNGSDEVLAIAFQAFFEPSGPGTTPERAVVFPDVTYSFYRSTRIFTTSTGEPFR